MTCQHWSDIGIAGAGACQRGLHGGRPSLGLCQGCPQNTAAGIWPPVAPPQPWPRWARWLANRRGPKDQGVGDTLARLLDPRGGKTWKRWYQALTGHPCGCLDRQRRLNALFPYPPKDSP
jgi:hypothetical protein